MSENPQGIEELMEFPCDYTFKAFGTNDSAFPLGVKKAVETVVPVSLDAMKSKVSGKGTYVSISVLVRLENYDQVKSIYQALRQVEGLKYLL